MNDNERNMTQEEIAEALDINRGLVNYIEKRALEKIRKAFAERGVDVSDFFGEEQ
jgi:transcriptional regulator